MTAIALFLLFLLHSVVDFLLIVMGLRSVNYFMKRIFFSRGRDLCEIMKREGTDSVCQSMFS